jgi:hypothetical protein
VSYTIEVGDGNFAVTNRANPTFTAPARINVGSNYGAAFQVGDVVKITGTPANDGIYTVAALITGTSVFDVAEAGIVAGSGAGNCAWYTNESTTLQAGTAITNFLAGSIIEAAGAAFVTNNVRKGDTAFVLGAGTTISGLYRIVEIISNTQIRVAGASRGRTAIAAGAGAGTVEVKGGAWRVDILDETAPSWSAIRTSATGPDGSTGADYITQLPLGNRCTLFRTHGLRQIRLQHTLNTASIWVSEREVVINDRTDAAVGVIQYESGSTPGDLVRLGQAGGDQYGGGNFGSAWIGWRVNPSATAPGPNDSLSMSMYGSYLLQINTGTGGAAAGTTGTGNQGSLVASLIDGYSLTAPGATSNVPGAVFTGSIESVIHKSAGFAVALFGAPAAYDNFLATEAGTAGVTISVTGFIQGFLASADVPTPYLQLLDSFLTVLNPRADYSLAELFTVFSGEGYLDYTWAPRFVERGSGIPIPIQGLTVRVFSVDESTLTETELSVSPFTTDVNGQIPAFGPGATAIGHGVDLTRGLSESGLDTLFSHRVIVEGPGYRRVDSYFTMRAAKINFDFPVDILRTDYEGEFST